MLHIEALRGNWCATQRQVNFGAIKWFRCRMTLRYDTSAADRAVIQHTRECGDFHRRYTHGYPQVGWLFTNEQTVELLQRLLLAFAFKTLGGQLCQGLVELLERDHTGGLRPAKQNEIGTDHVVTHHPLSFSSSNTKAKHIRGLWMKVFLKLSPADFGTWFNIYKMKI